jgi:dTMP kinase
VRFITVEGIEGSGKSTLLLGLAAWLGARGAEVVVTREPGGTALGDRLRALFVDPGLAIDPLAEAFVVNASRAEHVARVIEPALREGRFVLCDRFADATIAYQGYGRGVDLASLHALARIATHGREPDLTFLLDVGARVSQARLAERERATGVGADRLEREDAAFHERVRSGYLALARDDPRFVTLDGAQAPGAVLQAATTVLAEKYRI